MPDTTQNRRKCDAFLKRIEAEIVLGTFDYAAYFPDGGKVEVFRNLERRVASAKSDMPLFSDFAETWFAERRIEWRRSYADTMRITLDKYLLPHFGATALDLIEKPDIMTFRAGLGDQPGVSAGTTLSAARINKIMMPLRMILIEGADRFGFVQPMAQHQAGQTEEVGCRIRFTLDEVNRFLEAVRPDMRNYYAVRFFSGLRSSEVDGLKWQYVDFDKRPDPCPVKRWSKVGWKRPRPMDQCARSR